MNANDSRTGQYPSSGNARVLIHKLAAAGIIALVAVSGILAAITYKDFYNWDGPVIREPPDITATSSGMAHSKDSGGNTHAAPEEKTGDFQFTVKDSGELEVSPEILRTDNTPPEEHDRLCSEGSLRSCLTLGLWHYYGNISNASYSKADLYMGRACDLGNGAACYFQGTSIPQTDTSAERMLYALKRACDLNVAQGCSKAAIKLYERGDYASARDYASRACPAPENRSQSCLYLALASYGAGEQVPRHLHGLLKDTCTQFWYPEVCRAYAMSLPPDKASERRQIHDKICQNPQNMKFCKDWNAGGLRLEQRDSEQIRDLENTCRDGDSASCLRLARYYEFHDGHTALDRKKALEIYQDLCQKRDPEGCQELRRVQKALGK